MLAITTLPLCRHATLWDGALRDDTKNDRVAESWVLSCQNCACNCADGHRGTGTTWPSLRGIFSIESKYRLARTNSSGGGLPYEKEGDTRRKIRIELLKESSLGVALFEP